MGFSIQAIKNNFGLTKFKVTASSNKYGNFRNNFFKKKWQENWNYEARLYSVYIIVMYGHDEVGC